jgi:hypothetical protein
MDWPDSETLAKQVGLAVCILTTKQFQVLDMHVSLTMKGGRTL